MLDNSANVFPSFGNVIANPEIEGKIIRLKIESSPDVVAPYPKTPANPAEYP